MASRQNRQSTVCDFRISGIGQKYGTAILHYEITYALQERESTKYEPHL